MSPSVSLSSRTQGVPITPDPPQGLHSKPPLLYCRIILLRQSFPKTYLGPAVALGLVLVVRAAGLEHGLLGTASAGDLANSSTAGAGQDLGVWKECG